MLTKTLNIVPVADVKRSRSWAIYGRSGTGKTTFAGSFPKPCLFLDVNDQGTRSIIDVKGIEVAQITHWEQFEQVYDMLNTAKPRYKSVVIDTMTQAQLLAVNLILARARQPAVQQVGFATLTRQQWAAVAGEVRLMITLWCKLPIEVCFVAQERVFTIEEEADSFTEQSITPEVGAALTPSIVNHLNASVEVIANTFIRGHQRRDEKRKRISLEMIHSMRLGPNPVYTTKARKPRAIELPSEVDNPTHQVVCDIIEGKIE